MLEQSELSKLLAEMDSIRQELKDYKIKMNSLDTKKEELFRDKRKISSDIFSRIKEAKESKDKRNSLTDVVKNTKLSKEELEQKIAEIETSVHNSKEEKKKMLDKLGVDDPQKLKRLIKQLEFKIETDALTFEKEKELMKVLAKMKKQYAGSKAAHDLDRKIDADYKELHILKDQMEMTKKIVQVSAKESQKHHVELIESSKEIDELKAKEAELEKHIQKYKEEMHKLNEDMTPKMNRMDDIRKIMHENNIQLKEDVFKSNQELLRQKDADVQEKIKTGKKLTTEDLLILQRTMKG